MVQLLSIDEKGVGAFLDRALSYSGSMADMASGSLFMGGVRTASYGALHHLQHLQQPIMGRTVGSSAAAAFSLGPQQQADISGSDRQEDDIDATVAEAVSGPTPCVGLPLHWNPFPLPLRLSFLISDTLHCTAEWVVLAKVMTPGGCCGH